MDGRCTQRRLTLEYPKHRFKPEDLCILLSRQHLLSRGTILAWTTRTICCRFSLCIMAQPHGDGEIPDTGGCKTHTHCFDWTTINR